VSTSRSLTIKAAELAGRAPEDWLLFIEALAAHVEEVRDNCIRSPLDMLQINQGRAQALTAILKELRDAPKTARSLVT